MLHLEWSHGIGALGHTQGFNGTQQEIYLGFLLEIIKRIVVSQPCVSSTYAHNAFPKDCLKFHYPNSRKFAIKDIMYIDIYCFERVKHYCHMHTINGIG